MPIVFKRDIGVSIVKHDPGGLLSLPVLFSDTFRAVYFNTGPKGLDRLPREGQMIRGRFGK